MLDTSIIPFFAKDTITCVQPYVELRLSITTLRRWEAEGKLLSEHTAGKHRRYDLTKLKPELFDVVLNKQRTVAYARVSSHDQKNDLVETKTGIGVILRTTRLDISQGCARNYYGI